MAAYEKFTERNVVLRKMKAKPENKVCEKNPSLSSQFKCNDDLQRGGESGVATPKSSSTIPNVSSSLTEESDEARKRFANAKSISSAQFFGDDSADELRSKTTLTDKFNENFWWFVNKLDERLEVPEHPAVDVYGLRREVAELTLKLRSQDAASIPFATRWDMIANLRLRIRLALERHRNPKNKILLKSAWLDVHNLLVELCGFEPGILYYPSEYKPCLIEK